MVVSDRIMAGYRAGYTMDEDTEILKIIINTKAYYELKGNNFWKDCSNLGALDRTWASLQNRFFKNIVHDLYKYDIPLIEKRKIKLALFQCTPEGEACLKEIRAHMTSDEDSNAGDEDDSAGGEDDSAGDEDNSNKDSVSDSGNNE